MRAPSIPLLVTVSGLCALALVGIAACGGGSGAGVPLPGAGGQDPGAKGQEPGTKGQEPGASTLEPGTTGQEPTGSVGTDPPKTNPAPGSGSACLPCITYTCSASVGGQTTTFTLFLTPGSAGACKVKGSSVVLTCGGGITGQGDAGATGDWAATGTGGFTLPTNDGPFTCTPK